jgi:hypothetical protein
MVDEQRILSERESYITLAPKYSAGASILKEVSGVFLGFAPNFLVQNALKSRFAQSMKDGANIEQGDFKDIIGKIVKLKEVTLTNQNFFFVYEKGFMNKQQKLIVLPLQHAKTVIAYDGLWKKRWFKVSYEVPLNEKEKTQQFELCLSASNADEWSKAIQDLIKT